METLDLLLKLAQVIILPIGVFVWRMERRLYRIELKLGVEK